MCWCQLPRHSQDSRKSRPPSVVFSTKSTSILLSADVMLLVLTSKFLHSIRTKLRSIPTSFGNSADITVAQGVTHCTSKQSLELEARHEPRCCYIPRAPPLIDLIVTGAAVNTEHPPSVSPRAKIGSVWDRRPPRPHRACSWHVRRVKRQQNTIEIA